jgi:hypothetical protein
MPATRLDRTLLQDGLLSAVKWATTANLAATRSGNVLTATANGAIAVDGGNPAVPDRILVKDQSTGADGGIYTVTATGDESHPFVLTRAADADEAVEVVAGKAVYVQNGTVNAQTSWRLSSTPTVNVSTWAWSQLPGDLSQDWAFGGDVTVAGSLTAGGSYSNTADSTAVSNTASETTFDVSASIPSSLITAGKRFRVTAAGRYSTALIGAPTLTFRLKYGSTTIVSSGAVTTVANASGNAWWFDGFIQFRTTGMSGTAVGNAEATVQTGVGISNLGAGTSAGTVGVDTTGTTAIGVSITWSTADSSDTAVLEQITVVAVN